MTEPVPKIRKVLTLETTGRGFGCSQRDYILQQDVLALEQRLVPNQQLGEIPCSISTIPDWLDKGPPQSTTDTFEARYIPRRALRQRIPNGGAEA